MVFEVLSIVKRVDNFELRNTVDRFAIAREDDEKVSLFRRRRQRSCRLCERSEAIQKIERIL